MMNKIITAHFMKCGVPVSGLVPNITILLLDANNPTIFSLVASAQPMVELTQGWYRYDLSSYNPVNNYVFTIDGGVSLSINERYQIGANESFVDDVSSQVWEEMTNDHLATGSTGLMLNQIKADTMNIIVSQTTIAALVSTLLKYEQNRTKIDPLQKTLTIYDDDGTTPIKVFALKDSQGNLSILEVAERSPV